MKYNLVQLTAIILTGLVAGLFYGYNCSVITGLGNLRAMEYLLAFQSINKVILNPYFFSVFFGSLLMLIVATYLTYKKTQVTVQFNCLLGATVIYIIGVLGVTTFGNVPLNNNLAHFNMASMSDIAIENMRQAFEKQWNWFHNIRTFAAFISFFLSVVSLIVKKNEKN